MPGRTIDGGPKFQILKDKQRALRDGFPENLGLRVHRALSWLQRAEQAEDNDAAFIFYWVAFNAAYAGNFGETSQSGERTAFGQFFTEIIQVDSSRQVYEAIWSKFSDSIRLLLDNKFVFQPFWNFHNQIPGYEDWETRFENSQAKTRYALGKQNTKLILSILFDRLYVLRNQLVHGGATWNSSVNRAQVADGVRILGTLLPIFIDLMMDHPAIQWPIPHYPVVG
jgi:hypothetical protein